jgi:hypothetical protein
MDTLEAEANTAYEREALASRETVELQAELEKLGDPLKWLDCRGAHETRRVQRDLRIAEPQLEATLQELSAEGIRPSRGRPDGGESLDLGERVQATLDQLRARGILPEEGEDRPIQLSTNDRLGELSQRLLGDSIRDVQLRRNEQALKAERPDGRIAHLDEWMDRYRDDLPRILARENELAVRLVLARRMQERQAELWGSEVERIVGNDAIKGSRIRSGRRRRALGANCRPGTPATRPSCLTTSSGRSAICAAAHARASSRPASTTGTTRGGKQP